MKKALLALAILALPVMALPAQTTLTFDDIGCGICAVPNGYGGLNWNNFYALNTTSEPPSGYHPGTTSGQYVAFNGSGVPASVTQGSDPFAFNSGQFTAAWNDNLNLDVTGLVGGVPTYFASYILSATAPTLLTFNWANLSEVDFISSGGTQHSGYDQGSGTQFALDDLTINSSAVPEPASAALLGTGLVGLYGVIRRRRESAK